MCILCRFLVFSGQRFVINSSIKIVNEKCCQMGIFLTLALFFCRRLVLIWILKNFCNCSNVIVFSVGEHDVRAAEGLQRNGINEGIFVPITRIVRLGCDRDGFLIGPMLTSVFIITYLGRCELFGVLIYIPTLNVKAKCLSLHVILIHWWQASTQFLIVYKIKE